MLAKEFDNSRGGNRAWSGFPTRPFSSESTDQSSAIRDYSEFAVFAD